MDYYLKEQEKLQEELHDVMHHYPLFSEMIDEIFEKDIRDINELLEKNDEYYLKEANKKLSNLIDYIKTTSTKISKEYSKFDDNAKKWEKVVIKNMDNDELEKINAKINEANELITHHDLSDIEMANKIMEKILRDIA